MKWLTQKQVKAAAAKGRKPAIRCSLVHWQQIRTATKAELCKQMYAITFGPSLCGLCQYYNRQCGRCPLKVNGVSCCKEYDMATYMFIDRNWPRFNYWCDKLIKRLESLL